MSGKQRVGVPHPEDAVSGFRDGAPVALGTLPFALVMGITLASAGFTVSQATGMSGLVFAGLSQLAMTDLLVQQASLVVIVATALIVNLRFMMYSASIAPHFEHLDAVWRWLCPILLVAPVYAVSLNAFRQDRPTHYGWYFLGIALPAWVIWVAGTLAGLAVGARIPDEWQLGFAVPLLFIAILMQFVEDGATVVAALVGGAVSVGVVGLPLNLGLPVATAIGVVAGIWMEWRNA